MPNMVFIGEGQVYVGGLALVTCGYPYASGWSVNLFTNDITPNEDMSLEDFTFATFTGYSAFAIPNGWFAGVERVEPIQSRTTSNLFPQFTCTGGAPQTVYGWVMGVTGSMDAYFAQRLSTGRVMGPGAVLELNPFKVYIQSLH